MTTRSFLRSSALVTGLLALGALSACKGDPAETKEGAASSGDDAKPATPCDAAGEALSGIAILEVKDVPEGKEGGVKFVRQLRGELADVCREKGLEKTAADALACYGANKGKAGYRVLKGCDEAPGKDLVAAVVAKHGGKKSEK